MTSVLWNTALPSVLAWLVVCLRTVSSASGRRARSAKRTLQPRDRSSLAKARLIPIGALVSHTRDNCTDQFTIPDPAPVTMAVFPSTEKAIVKRTVSLILSNCSVACLGRNTTGDRIYIQRAHGLLPEHRLALQSWGALRIHYWAGQRCSAVS